MSSREKKSYRQFCGLARALDVVGERWTLLLVRELLLGTRRYGDLLASLPGLTTNLLATRLKALEQLGLLARDENGYALTPDGAALEPAIMELARWGGRYLLNGPKRGERVDVAWGLLSLKRRYRGGLDVTLGLEVDDVWFTLTFEPEWLRVLKGRPPRARASIHLSAQALRALLFGGASLASLVDEGSMSIDGERRVIERALCALLPPSFASQPATLESRTRFTPGTSSHQRAHSKST